MIKQIFSNWKRSFAIKQFGWFVLFTILFFSLSAYFSIRIIDFCEVRKGIVLHDILLRILPAIDVSNYIFFLTYGTIVITFLSILPYPKVVLKGFQMYALLLLLRAFFVWLIPLDPPSQMILMSDKIGNFLMNNNHMPITKDLFFSGHTSTLVLLFLIAKNRYLKIFILVLCGVVPILLLLQHIHYSIDVVAAPAFAFITYWVVNKTHEGLKSCLADDANK
jgi:PAP2 superfamily C-terminal